MRYIINNKVKTKWSKLAQLCLLAAIPAFFGCADDGNGYFLGDTVPMTLYLQTSNAHQTRAYIGDLAAEPEAESKINSIKVWFVDPTEGMPVAYSGTVADNKVTVTLPRTLVSKGTADVYIIANAESAGLAAENLTKESSVAQITAATIAVDKFGTATPVTAVPETGLPMSRIVKGLALTEGGKPKTDLGEISLTRAVSKIRFAFGMYTGDLGEIVGISLDGNQIAGAEYIMPVDPSNTDDYTAPYQGDLKANITPGSYQANELLLGSKTEGTLVANTAIHTTTTTDNPSNYTWDKWTKANSSVEGKATAYNTVITPFVTHTVYLRETDKQLTGKIYYRLSSTAGVQEAPFSMVANETPVQDFARNHVWIVYSYFEGGKLYVKPTVAPWTDAPVLDYTLKMSTNMRLFDSWLYRYDTDNQYGQTEPNPEKPETYYNHWAGSHIAVSNGRVESPVAPEAVAGRPLYSPQIQLVTTGVADASVPNSGTFELTIDNADFEILRANKTDGVVTSYDASTDGKLTIDAGTDVYTYFYIVPKEGVTPANPEAKVWLIYNDPVLGPQKVTFNNNALPGYSDDSSEIWAYYVTNENYNITDKLKMYYQDANHPLVPTPVQN